MYYIVCVINEQLIKGDKTMTDIDYMNAVATVKQCLDDAEAKRLTENGPQDQSIKISNLKNALLLLRAVGELEIGELEN